MNRHYYVSDDLDDLESLEHELEDSGVNIEQIHVLSDNEAELEHHHLHAVDSFSRSDVIRSGIIGLLCGLLASIIILSFTYFSGVYETITWVPPIFLSVVSLGFCTWEGGLWGIQKINRVFRRFKEDLKMGRHVFFVDVRPDQEPTFQRIVRNHPHLTLAGDGSSTPEWITKSQIRMNKFTHWAP
ncbi:magnesium transporter [Aestuariicella hydrocarbonica]|uniref:Magnesium transporter n=1 Tax=Pseudomaricurvus hydrocarbonicus TaxID=1470433 RepID=A0A9E5MML7_9GAMM|nr:magnesium transporter [Aestuariicella hydrocarbonica]NHO67027.1 magnesium transporter [Aestuariicella hydrocarbonica]